jgi:GntR family transcriptional regulator
MAIGIDIEAVTPRFAQLVASIKQAVLSGELAPGDPLPSIRRLARDLALNSKTVAKAYRLLERDAVVQGIGGRGTFVHPDARANCTTDLEALAGRKLASAVSALRRAGVTDPEIRKAFGRAMRRRRTWP